MLRILADENLPGDAVTALRAAGHDVVWVRTDSPGITDADVLEFARREQRLLLTMDKDFGSLVFRAGKEAPSGIILFRIAMPTPKQVAGHIVAVLASRTDWTEHFSVIDDTSIRMTRLPLE